MPLIGQLEAGYPVRGSGLEHVCYEECKRRLQSYRENNNLFSQIWPFFLQQKERTRSEVDLVCGSSDKPLKETFDGGSSHRCC
jgi:hypothetical protein